MDNLLIAQVAQAAEDMARGAAKAPGKAAAKAAAKTASAQEAAKADAGGEKDAAASSAGAAPAAGAPALETAATATPWYLDALDSGAMKYMIDGGIFMWPILIMAIVATGVTIERLRSLKMLDVDTSALRRRILELLQADRGMEALEYCAGQQGPVPAVLTAGIQRYLVLKKLNYDPARIEEQVVKAMEDYSVHIIAALERHLPILATISSVAPMVGSVGTVTGMIILFEDITNQMGTANIIQLAAAGIKVKLLVTVWGLMVGIPAYVAFNYFTTVINRYVLSVEESATELMEAVTLQMACVEPSGALGLDGSPGPDGAIRADGAPGAGGSSASPLSEVVPSM
jgi:biopolymer transport protein ExbB